MLKSHSPIYYGDYLQLDSLLKSQNPLSGHDGSESHDEMLFIITHQTYELWFKQILHDLDSLIQIFRQNYVNEKDLGLAVMRLDRIIKIFQVVTSQLNILETMTPLDFLDFRDYLTPASGFQSVQFRLLELKLGLPLGQQGYPKEFFYNKFSPADGEKMRQAEGQKPLMACLDKWLERIPFIQLEGFDFWQLYHQTVTQLLQQEGEIIQQHKLLSPQEKKAQLENLKSTQETFRSLTDGQVHEQLVAEHKRRLSQKAMQAAIFIQLYRDEPILHLPFKFISGLVDLDEVIATWRYRHAMLAHRMIGTKIGTGGSSGHQYLKSTIERGRLFQDFFNLSTFLIPRSFLPQLPESLKLQLGFYFRS